MRSPRPRLIAPVTSLKDFVSLPFHQHNTPRRVLIVCIKPDTSSHLTDPLFLAIAELGIGSPLRPSSSSPRANLHLRRTRHSLHFEVFAQHRHPFGIKYSRAPDSREHTRAGLSTTSLSSELPSFHEHLEKLSPYDYGDRTWTNRPTHDKRDSKGRISSSHRQHAFHNRQYEFFAAASCVFTARSEVVRPRRYEHHGDSTYIGWSLRARTQCSKANRRSNERLDGTRRLSASKQRRLERYLEQHGSQPEALSRYRRRWRIWQLSERRSCGPEWKSPSNQLRLDECPGRRTRWCTIPDAECFVATAASGPTRHFSYTFTIPDPPASSQRWPPAVKLAKSEQWRTCIRKSSS